jgi:hypothetical protein
MSHTRTWYLNLSTAFPADRPVAGLMARLMVVWADALLEHDAMGGDEEGKGSRFEGLDFLDPMYRRLYFWRSLTTTLASGQNLLNLLVADPEFKTWLSEAPDLETQFFEAKLRFDRDAQTVTSVRNNASADIEEAIGEVPKRLSPETRGFVEVGGKHVIRPKFAFHLLVAALLPDLPADKAEARMRELLTEAKAAFTGWADTAYVAVELYHRHHPLFPGWH